MLAGGRGLISSTPRVSPSRMKSRLQRPRSSNSTVNARATFEKPNQYSEGMPYVAVNGVLVVDQGKITAAAPGKALRGPGYRP